jgi:hypothetical protein
LRSFSLVPETSKSGAGTVSSSKRILSFLSFAAIAFFAACGGNNNLALENPPAPAAKSISISFSPTPVSSISLGVMATTFTAVVDGDSTDSGVDWALLCQSGANCGTLTPLHTASGAPATFKPPATINGNVQAVTIEAFATANHDSNAFAKLTITGFAGNLKGKYVFETTGEDANGFYQLAGVIVLDGNGNVTSGEQTHSDPLVSVSDRITGGSYYIGPDGRGTLTINTADQNIGQLGIENLALELISNSQAFIATFDSPLLQPSEEVSSGTLDLQGTVTPPTGGYAFVVNGCDVNTLSMAMGGIFNIDSPNTISGAGSVADQDDSQFGASGVTTSSPLSGTLTDPDSYGALKFNLRTGFAASMQFTGYIVDSTHMKLIESDVTAPFVGFGTTAGVAIGQGAATGTFTSNNSFAGTYVFDIQGQDSSGIPDTLNSYGQFSADSSGNLASPYDDEYLSSLSNSPTGGAFGFTDSFTGTYTLSPPGTGRVDTNSSITFSTQGQGPELIFYLTGNSNPPLVLDADDNGNSVGFGSIGTGFSHPKGTPPFSFNGRYGVEFTDSEGLGFVPNTATGQVAANGSARTLNGTVDTNSTFTPNPDLPLTGTFGDISTGGRFTGTLVNAFFPSPTSVAGAVAVAFYPVDDNLIFFTETDLLVSGQGMFGRFVTRTPVCSVCQ